MHGTRAFIVAGLLAFAAQTAYAAAPPRTMDLEILANGQLILRGELIDGMNDLEAKLRVMRENEPPFELGIKLPKTIGIDAFAPFMKMFDDLRARFGFTGDGGTPRPAPADPDRSTI